MSQPLNAAQAKCIRRMRDGWTVKQTLSAGRSYQSSHAATMCGPDGAQEPVSLMMLRSLVRIGLVRVDDRPYERVWSLRS